MSKLIKPEPKQEFDDLEELRRQIANEELATAYDREKHINEIKSKITKDLNDEVPVKLTDEICELGLLSWFREITTKYENARRLKALWEKANEENESEISRSFGINDCDFRLSF
ncbi:MAG TPA: hypothetical protein VKR58_05880 [Aquella sp.]|nr:hypothetical protein [Aquella sp.]